MTKPVDRCVKRVHDGGRSVSFHQCLFRGVLEHNGEKYCKIHYPPTVQEKKDEQSRQWQADWDREKRARAKADAIRKAEQWVLEEAMLQWAKPGPISPSMDRACSDLKALGWGPKS